MITEAEIDNVLDLFSDVIAESIEENHADFMAHARFIGYNEKATTYIQQSFVDQDRILSIQERLDFVLKLFGPKIRSPLPHPEAINLALESGDRSSAMNSHDTAKAALILTRITFTLSRTDKSSDGDGVDNSIHRRWREILRTAVQHDTDLYPLRTTLRSKYQPTPLRAFIMGRMYKGYSSSTYSFAVCMGQLQESVTDWAKIMEDLGADLTHLGKREAMLLPYSQDYRANQPPNGVIGVFRLVELKYGKKPDDWESTWGFCSNAELAEEGRGLMPGSWVEDQRNKLWDDEGYDIRVTVDMEEWESEGSREIDDDDLAERPSEEHEDESVAGDTSKAYHEIDSDLEDT